MSGLAGLGLRPEIAPELLREPGAIDVLELLFESSVASRRAEREALAFARAFPTVVHGVKLSLGSAAGVARERAERLGRFAREVGARAVSEHAAFVRAGGREIGHLTALPFSREAVAVVARNVAAARRHLPDVPFLLENAAWGFRPPGDEMDEGTFHAELVRATGCGMLLDVSNVIANARNAGVAPAALLARYPLEAAGQVHVAGGAWDGHGFWLDTHGHPVELEGFALVARVTEAAGEIPIILERDEDFPSFGELAGEVRRARAASAEGAARAAGRAPTTRAAPAEGAPVTGSLEGLQARIAAALLGDRPEPSLGLDAVAHRRAARVLHQKRLEAALTLLPHAAALPDLARAARALLPPGGAGEELQAPTDALALAEALLSRRVDEPARRALELDRAVLAARFSRGPRGLERRAGPSVRRVRAGGRDTWVIKGVGRGAEVRVVTRSGGLW